MFRRPSNLDVWTTSESLMDTKLGSSPLPEVVLATPMAHYQPNTYNFDPLPVPPILQAEVGRASCSSSTFTPPQVKKSPSSLPSKKVTFENDGTQEELCASQCSINSDATLFNETGTPVPMKDAPVESADCTVGGGARAKHLQQELGNRSPGPGQAWCKWHGASNNIIDLPEARVIHEKRVERYPDIPPDVPLGPIAGDVTTLKNVLVASTASATTCTSFVKDKHGILQPVIGGHGMKKHEQRPYVEKNQYKFKCNEKPNCPYSLEYQESTAGHVLHNCQCVHNHDLNHDINLSNMRRQNRGPIHDSLIEYGSTLQGIATPRVIFESLQRRAKELHVNHNFTYQDVYDMFALRSAAREFDARNLIEHLKERKECKGLEYFFDTNANNELNHLFVQLEQSLDTWSLAGDQNVLLFDPTHGTNVYRMKLCSFVTVGENFDTRILAVALLPQESTECFQWAFRKFGETFKKPPTAIFTDSDPGIKRAIQTTAFFDKTHHHFCIWHLSKNVYTHLRRHFSDVQKWTTAHDMFWKVCKETDQHTRHRWKDDWEDLVQIFSTNMDSTTGNTSVRQEELAWLSSLGERGQNFAYRFTWSRRTWGVNSTARSEAIHSAIKQKAMHNLLLTDLVKQLEEHNESQHLRNAMAAAARHHRNEKSAELVPPLIIPFAKEITPRAFDLLKEQAKQAMFYIVSREEQNMGDGNDTYKVTRRQTVSADAALAPSKLEYDEKGKVQPSSWPEELHDDAEMFRVATIWSCSCQYLEHIGIACRHQLAIMIIQQMESVDIGRICGLKWRHTDSEERSRRLQLLLQCRPCRSRCAEDNEETEMTVKEMRTYLIQQMRALVDYGCENGESRCMQVASAVSTLLEELKETDLREQRKSSAASVRQVRNSRRTSIPESCSASTKKQSSALETSNPKDDRLHQFLNALCKNRDETKKIMDALNGPTLSAEERAQRNAIIDRQVEAAMGMRPNHAEKSKQLQEICKLLGINTETTTVPSSNPFDEWSKARNPMFNPAQYRFLEEWEVVGNFIRDRSEPLIDPRLKSVLHDEWVVAPTRPPTTGYLNLEAQKYKLRQGEDGQLGLAGCHIACAWATDQTSDSNTKKKGGISWHIGCVRNILETDDDTYPPVRASKRLKDMIFEQANYIVTYDDAPDGIPQVLVAQNYADDTTASWVSDEPHLWMVSDDFCPDGGRIVPWVLLDSVEDYRKNNLDKMNVSDLKNPERQRKSYGRPAHKRKEPRAGPGNKEYKKHARKNQKTTH